VVVPVEQIPSRLTQLPEWRYKNLVWHQLEAMSFAEIEWWALGRAQSSCRVGERFEETANKRLTHFGAVLGSDGAYHLLTAAGFSCGGPDETGAVRHHRKILDVHRQ
jgi:hypothetical protein